VKLIVIDPGHGGHDTGAVYEGYEEKNFTLLLSLKVRDYLLSSFKDMEIILTRTKDVFVSLGSRARLANDKKADFFLSMHLNAGGGTGFESYVFSGAISKETEKYREIIHEHAFNAIKKFNVVDRGFKKANYQVLRETKMPAILIESLFIDNKNDLELLNNAEFTNELSKGIAEGVAVALALPKKTLFKVIAYEDKDKALVEEKQRYLRDKGIESIILTLKEKTVKDKNENVLYRLQAGAYKLKETAMEKVKKLVNLGFEKAFILEE